jgi:hypothetical protein
MWKRWHPTTHIWERSSDNGATWSPLPLNAASINEGVISAARLPPYIAYANVNNNFASYSAAQSFASGNYIMGPNMHTEYVDSGGLAGCKRFRTLAYQGTDAYRFEWLSDDATAVTGTPLMMYRDGRVGVQGSLDIMSLAHPIGQWKDYVATWSSGGVLPVIGNGTVRGRYTQIDRTIWFLWEMLSGSTTTFGTGNYLYNLPKHAAAAYIGYLFPVFYGMLQDVNVDKSFPVMGTIATPDQGVLRSVAGDYVSSTLPITLAASDTLRVMGCYQTI